MTDYKALSDLELLALLGGEDHTALAEIHNRYFPALYRSAFNVLRDKDACLDVIQEVFIWFWQHRARHSMNSIKGYLLMAVKYQVANAIRSGKARTALSGRLAAMEWKQISLEDTLELRELQAIIAAFSAGLPERCREVFQLSREEQLTNKEIAEKMGIAEKTVEAQITKALGKLRTQLGQMNFWLFLF